MKNTTEMGLNRSGLATAPLMAPRMLEVPGLTVPSMPGDERLIAAERIQYARESEPLATMPPPGSLKELAKTTVKLLKGEKAMVLTDKLGERLAFERAGTRLYEAMLSKHDAYGSWEGGPTRTELEQIHAEEKAHFLLVSELVSSLGSDPTAVTPSAEVHDVLSQGLRALVTDARSTLRQCLEAALVAELVDNDGWSNLIDLAQGMGEEELADQLESCLIDEERHLALVRAWLAAGVSVDATGDAEAMETASAEAPARVSSRAAESARSARPAASRGGAAKRPPATSSKPKGRSRAPAKKRR